MHYSFRFLAPALLTAVSLFGAHGPAASQVTIPITTAHNVLLLRADPSGNLNTIYFGEKLADSGEYKIVTGDAIDLLAAAYTPSGSRNLAEPALSVTHSDGNRSLDLRYVSHNVTKESADVSLVSINLKDPVYPVEVTLYYKVYDKEDVVEQWSRIVNREKGNPR